MTPPSPKRKDSGGYSIGAAARLAGLNPQLIRAWEQRYGAVVAAREENGRRCYSAADVEKLTLLKTPEPEVRHKSTRFSTERIAMPSQRNCASASLKRTAWRSSPWKGTSGSRPSASFCPICCAAR